MAIEIVRESAQDEVCGEIWDVLQAVKRRVEVILSDAPHDASFTHELTDLTELMSRIGRDYRHHAETSPSLWVRHVAAVRDFDEENAHWTTMELPRPDVTVNIADKVVGTAMNTALHPGDEIRIRQ